MNVFSLSAGSGLTRLLQKTLAAVGLSMLALSAQASPENPRNGTEYFTLKTAQPTESRDKVEVIEFFWYSCGVCNVVEPIFHDWTKSKGANVAVRRIPAVFRDDMVPQQRLYFALEAMGLVDTLHVQVFQAIHSKRVPMQTEADIMKWIGTQNVDKQKFADAFNSFGVNTKVSRAKQLQDSYGINGVPTFIVDGRYMTSPAIVANSVGNKPLPVLAKSTFQVIDALVAERTKAKGGAAAR